MSDATMESWLDEHPPRNPALDQVDALEKIECHLRVLRDGADPVTQEERSMFLARLDTLSQHAPQALAVLKSIQIAAWVIAAATVVHLFR